MYSDDRLKAGLEALHITYSEQMLERLHKYYEMMVEKNQVMNLTSITEYDDVVVKHWLDSLCFAKEYISADYTKRVRLIDIGTGAGFPGIPVKIFFPEIDVVLLDSLNKRIVFLQDVVEKLGLTSITCIHGRAEELSNKPEYREQFDFAVSRAVARLASLSELCIPFVKPAGIFLSYKSEAADEEIEESKFAIRTLGCKLEKVLDYTIPTSDLPRKMVVIKKVSATPLKYPRGGGKPLKAPLLGK